MYLYLISCTFSKYLPQPCISRSINGGGSKNCISRVFRAYCRYCFTHHVKLRRGPLHGATARGRRDRENEEPEAGEEEGDAGGDVAVQLEVLVQLEGDPEARQEKDGPGRLQE